MSGIQFKVKTKNLAAVKLLSNISTYLFEQEHGELRYAKEIDKKRLMMAQKALSNIIKLGMKQ